MVHQGGGFKTIRREEVQYIPVPCTYVEEEEQHLCHVGGMGLCDTLLFMFVCLFLFLFVGVVFVFVCFNCFPFLYLLCTYRINSSIYQLIDQ